MNPIGKAMGGSAHRMPERSDEVWRLMERLSAEKVEDAGVEW